MGGCCSFPSYLVPRSSSCAAPSEAPTTQHNNFVEVRVSAIHAQLPSPTSKYKRLTIKNGRQFTDEPLLATYGSSYDQPAADAPTSDAASDDNSPDKRKRVHRRHNSNVDSPDAANNAAPAQTSTLRVSNNVNHTPARATGAKRTNRASMSWLFHGLQFPDNKKGEDTTSAPPHVDVAHVDAAAAQARSPASHDADCSGNSVSCSPSRSASDQQLPLYDNRLDYALGAAFPTTFPLSTPPLVDRSFDSQLPSHNHPPHYTTSSNHPNAHNNNNNNQYDDALFIPPSLQPPSGSASAATSLSVTPGTTGWNTPMELEPPTTHKLTDTKSNPNLLAPSLATPGHRKRPSMKINTATSEVTITHTHHRSSSQPIAISPSNASASQSSPHSTRSTRAPKWEQHREHHEEKERSGMKSHRKSNENEKEKDITDSPNKVAVELDAKLCEFQQTIFFHLLSSCHFDEFISLFTLISYPASTPLFTQSSPLTSLLFLRSGAVNLTCNLSALPRFYDLQPPNTRMQSTENPADDEKKQDYHNKEKLQSVAETSTQLITSSSSIHALTALSSSPSPPHTLCTLRAPHLFGIDVLFAESLDGTADDATSSHMFTATAAASGCECWLVDRAAIIQFLSKYPSVQTAFRIGFATGLTDFLSKHPLFNTFPSNTLRLLAQLGSFVSFQTNEMLYLRRRTLHQQSRRSRGACYIIKGSLHQLTSSTATASHAVGSSTLLGFEELALGVYFPYYYKTAEPTIVWRLPHAAFFGWCKAVDIDKITENVKKNLENIHITIVNLFHHPVFFSHFFAFLSNEYSSENLLFWSLVYSFRLLFNTTPPEQLSQLIQEIMNGFLLPNSKYELQISTKEKNDVITAYLKGEQRDNMFELCEASIINLIRFDSFPRFRFSPAFNACVRDMMHKKHIGKWDAQNLRRWAREKEKEKMQLILEKQYLNHYLADTKIHSGTHQQQISSAFLASINNAPRRSTLPTQKSSATLKASPDIVQPLTQVANSNLTAAQAASLLAQHTEEKSRNSRSVMRDREQRLERSRTRNMHDFQAAHVPPSLTPPQFTRRRSTLAHFDSVQFQRKLSAMVGERDEKKEREKKRRHDQQQANHDAIVTISSDVNVLGASLPSLLTAQEAERHVEFNAIVTQLKEKDESKPMPVFASSELIDHTQA